MFFYEETLRRHSREKWTTLRLGKKLEQNRVFKQHNMLGKCLCGSLRQQDAHLPSLERCQDPYLRNFPRLYVISYQGSEVSTSEGITKAGGRHSIVLAH